jgi:hypothetical protein
MEPLIVKFTFLLVTTMFCTILIGCASGGALYNEKPIANHTNNAQIILFRKHQFTAGGACYKTYLDAKQYGVLANGGFIISDVESGLHNISVKDNKLSLPISVEAGKRYYIEYSISLSDLSAIPVGTATSVSMGFDFYLANVTSAYAMQLLPKLKDSSVKYTCMNTQ